LNWERDPPLVKNVPLVPSGPTKLKGPEALLLAAAWSWTFVLAGVVAVQEIVVQSGVEPAAGLASFTEEMRLPEGRKPVVM